MFLTALQRARGEAALVGAQALLHIGGGLNRRGDDHPQKIKNPASWETDGVTRPGLTPYL